ncbi:hypothetical protein [Staphylococcus sp. HMSC056D08]|uniref:hypothetical protein n=1 Tax=Staphylococcus sp. HMSC056D08 TaxID=1739455 RepID=UPI0008AA235A|nr:hypothetical protein [Staphylococcus sp. HMSC056D08]OHR45984.1 hypothetical protein HMPREF2951_07230 [Staphylococcus sp. HMSC056D08]
MKELPKDRLTVKEIWTESKLESTLNKAQKESYRKMSIDKKRDILHKYKNEIPFYIEELSEKELEIKSIEKTLNKRGLNSLTMHSKELMNKNQVGQFIDSFMSRFSSAFTNPSNSDTIFTYEMINQNFVIIKLLDDNFKQNDTLIRQNKEIIALLQKIADQH